MTVKGQSQGKLRGKAREAGGAKPRTVKGQSQGKFRGTAIESYGAQPLSDSDSILYD